MLSKIDITSSIDRSINKHVLADAAVPLKSTGHVLVFPLTDEQRNVLYIELESAEKI